VGFVAHCNLPLDMSQDTSSNNFAYFNNIKSNARLKSAPSSKTKFLKVCPSRIVKSNIIGGPMKQRNTKL